MLLVPLLVERITDPGRSNFADERLVSTQLLHAVHAGQPSGPVPHVAVLFHGAILVELHRVAQTGVDWIDGAILSADQARRAQQHQVRNAAPVDRQLLDARALQVPGDGRFGGRQQGSGIAHGNLCGHRPCFQSGADFRGLPNRQQKGALPGLHARRCRDDLIVAGLDRRKHEEPGLIGGCRVLPHRVRMSNADSRPATTAELASVTTP